MDAEEKVVINLTDDERRFMSLSINEWFGPAHGQLMMLPLLALPNKAAFSDMVKRLRDACWNREPLTDLDWARALLLTEISWGSNLLGAGIDSVSNFKDEIAVDLLRSIQYKVSSWDRRRLLEIEAGIATGE